MYNITNTTNTTYNAFNKSDDVYYFNMMITSIILSSVCVLVCCSQIIILIIRLCYRYLIIYSNNLHKRIITLNPFTSLVIANIIEIRNEENNVV